MVMPRPCVDRGGPGLSLEPLDAFIVHVFASYEADDRHGHDFFVKKVHHKKIACRATVATAQIEAPNPSFVLE